MKQDKNIGGQANEKELTHKELEKVNGGLKMAPAAFDPDLFQADPLTGDLGGRVGGGGDPRGLFGGRGGMSGDLGSGVLGGRVSGGGDF